MNVDEEMRRILAAKEPNSELSGMALAMKNAPSIGEVVLQVMRDHYWDSLEPQRDLIIKHIEGALAAKKFNPQSLSKAKLAAIIRAYMMTKDDPNARIPTLLMAYIESAR